MLITITIACDAMNHNQTEKAKQEGKRGREKKKKVRFSKRSEKKTEIGVET